MFEILDAVKEDALDLVDCIREDAKDFAVSLNETVTLTKRDLLLGAIALGACAMVVGMLKAPKPTVITVPESALEDEEEEEEKE